MNKKQMKEFMKALEAIVAEKGIDKAIVIEAMEQAMAAAYKKKGGPARCEVNPDTGEIKLFSVTGSPISPVSIFALNFKFNKLFNELCDSPVV